MRTGTDSSLVLKSGCDEGGSPGKVPHWCSEGTQMTPSFTFALSVCLFGKTAICIPSYFKINIFTSIYIFFLDPAMIDLLDRSSSYISLALYYFKLYRIGSASIVCRLVLKLILKCVLLKQQQVWLYTFTKFLYSCSQCYKSLKTTELFRD